MGRIDSAHLDELLDWLADEVARRLRAGEATAPEGTLCDGEQPLPEVAVGAGTGELEDLPAWPAERGKIAAPDEPDAPAPVELARPEDDTLAIASTPAHAAPLLGRLAIGLLVAVLLVNIPFGAHGAALARMIPSSSTVIVHNGLLVKETDKPEVYVYQDGQFRWVTDPGVFEHYGYQWQHVQDVAPGFLAGYEVGRPLYLLAKCPGSPHIYRLENGVKHWIVDIAALEAEGHRWSDVRTIDCITLRAMPVGETIPAGRGPAPQP